MYTSAQSPYVERNMQALSVIEMTWDDEMIQHEYQVLT
jgi:hypothetical protein